MDPHTQPQPAHQAERIGAFVGRPVFLFAIVLFVAVWMGTNLALLASGRAPFDEPPCGATCPT